MGLQPNNPYQKMQEMAVIVDRLQGQVAALLAYVSVTASALGEREIKAMRSQAQQRTLDMLAPLNNDAPGLTANHTIDQIQSMAAALDATRNPSGS